MSSGPRIVNRLGELRRSRGVPAAALAAGAGVSRQTIYAIETGSFVPNTAVALRLARILETSVDELFRLEEPAPPAPVRAAEFLPGGPPPRAGQPVRLCQVGSKTLAASAQPVPWYLPPADGVLLSARALRARVQLFHEEEAAPRRLLVAGCDPGMPVLARHMLRAGVELVLVNRNSSQSLELLRQGLVHVAGSHLRDKVSGESNLPVVRRLFPRRSAAVISFALWEEGIVVRPGNPKRIRGVADLARSGVTLVNREPGSGSRQLLETSLAEAGIPFGSVAGYEREAAGHLPAAFEVFSGAADCCSATRAAARAFGLDFLPLVQERYDLVLRRRGLDLPAVQTLLDTLTHTSFRRELEGLGGYDTRAAGDRLA